MEKSKIKIIYGVIAIVIVVVGVVVIKYLKEANEENNTLVGDYTPEAEITEDQARQTIVSLYFPGKESHELMPEARLVDVKELINFPYEKIFNMLMEGPKNDKLEGIIPENTKILKTYLDKDCVVFDLSKDFLNFDMEKENAKENLINSIVNSLTELTEVNKVKFLIEGQENEQFKDIYVRINK